MPELKGLSYDDVLRKPGWKRGFIKCRLIHMDGRSIVQPDILLSSKLDGKFFIRLIPLHPVKQYEGATQLSVGERVVGRESALCLGLSRVAPLGA